MSAQDQELHPVGSTPISSQSKRWVPQNPISLAQLVEIDGPQGAVGRTEDTNPDRPNESGHYAGRLPPPSTILGTKPNWGDEGLPGLGALGTATMVPVSADVVAPGGGYAPTNELSLVGGTSTETGVLVVDSVKTISGQDELDFDSGADEGSFTGGTGYAATQVITMSDGTTVTVDSVTGGVVTTFTITTISTTPHTSSGDVLTQSFVTGPGEGGIGFTLTLDFRNQGAFVVSPNQVSGVNVGEYTVLPSDPVSVTGGSSAPGGATFNVDWGVKNITVTAGGSGYIQPPPVAFGGQGGSGTVATSALTADAVSSASVSDPGLGYTERATVIFVDE